MDAVKFLEEWKRMHKNGRAVPALDANIDFNSEKVVKIVEEWSAEHPRKTIQDLFLEHYPDARIGDNGCICLCPGDVFDVYRDAYGNCAKPDAFCPNCRKDFWMAEVDGE